MILVLKKREKKSNITRLFLITIHWTTHHSLISNTSKWNPSTRSIFHVLQPCERKNFFYFGLFFLPFTNHHRKKQHFNTTFLTLKDHLIKWWTNQKKKRNIEQNQEVLGPKKYKKKHGKVCNCGKQQWKEVWK